MSRYFSGLLGLDRSGPDASRRFRYLRNGDVLAPEDWPMRVAARQGVTVRGEELEVRFDDGRKLEILVSAAPLVDARGGARGAVAAIMDITALKDVQRRLEEANRQKSEFLSVLAHELRNPMAAIGYSVDLLRHAASPEAIAKARDVIGRQTAHMGKLLDDLLDLSRIAYNRIELALKPLDLRHVLDLAYDSTRAEMEKLGHDVRFELPAAPLMVLGDEVRLTQVLSNLLNNAAKFTPAGGTIVVKAEATAQRVELAVSDNGVGIEPRQLEHIFEMFSQSESKVSGGTPGLGIGLAVVRMLVELHGGSVWAVSAGPGKGTTLRLDLPRIAAADAPQAADGLPAQGRHGRLLVADDNVDAADLLAALLDAEGYAVRTAYDGEAAIGLAEEWKPDLLLLDIGMPLANGLEVARWVRARDWGRDAVLIAVTGWGQEEDRKATREAGFDAHVVKPVSPTDILRIIDQTLPPRPAEN